MKQKGKIQTFEPAVLSHNSSYEEHDGRVRLHGNLAGCSALKPPGNHSGLKLTKQTRWLIIDPRQQRILQACFTEHQHWRPIKQ